MDFIHSEALIGSLHTSPLLVEDLPEALSLDRSLLGTPKSMLSLNENQKLGHLYEDALRILLEASERLELLGDHIQVFDENQITLGEMDYLVRDQATQECFQLELAVKFYLAVQTPTGWAFPGPDPKDNWLRKLKRMQGHQFTLAHRAEAQALLHERWGIDHIEVKQLIYGCIFHPLGMDVCILPKGVRTNCRTGRWLYVDDWAQHFGAVAQVHVVPKYLWPIELTAELRQTLPLVSVEALQASARARCVMFTLPNMAEPYFLVPARWPTALA
jgi:hypothetical protein